MYKGFCGAEFVVRLEDMKQGAVTAEGDIVLGKHHLIILLNQFQKDDW